MEIDQHFYKLKKIRLIQEHIIYQHLS
jgi:hypothetical protein